MNFKDLTIVVIDSLNHNLTTLALDKTREIFPQAQVVVFGDYNFYDHGKFIKVDKFSQPEHSKICLHDVYDAVDTNWALFIQYDGFPIREDLWLDEFLKYDYIGSPMGAPEIVGNGGFCLRSKKLLNLTRFIPQGHTPNDWLEDQLICNKYRPWLEKHGVTFAPLSIARRWGIQGVSHHNPTGYFGFHGPELIAAMCGREFTLRWLANATDSIFKNKNVYLIPYHLWLWQEYEELNKFITRANKIQGGGWQNYSLRECAKIKQFWPKDFNPQAFRTAISVRV
jgi:hypothetical protein